MASACTGQAGEDCRRSPPARVPDEEGIFSVENDALHLALGDVVVDGHGAIMAEDVQFVPLAQRILDRLSHGMPGQQLFLPGKHSQAELGEQRRCLVLAYLATLVSGRILSLALDGIERANTFDSLTRDFRCGLLRIDELSSKMSPTAGARAEGVQKIV